MKKIKMRNLSNLAFIFVIYYKIWIVLSERVQNKSISSFSDYQYTDIISFNFSSYHSFDYKIYLTDIGDTVYNRYYCSTKLKQKIIDSYLIMSTEMRMINYDIINIVINNKNQTHLNNGYHYSTYGDLENEYNTYNSFLKKYMSFKNYEIAVEKLINTTSIIEDFHILNVDEEEAISFADNELYHKKSGLLLNKRKSNNIDPIYYIAQKAFVLELQSSYVFDIDSFCTIKIGFYSKYFFGFGERNHEFFLKPGIYHTWPNEQVSI
jgi:hypothetical protein